jgi:hypothetical protein
MVMFSVQVTDDQALFKDLDDDEREFARQIDVPAARRSVSIRELINRLDAKGAAVSENTLGQVRRDALDPRLRGPQERLLADLTEGDGRLLSALAFMLINTGHSEEIVRVAAAAALAPALSKADACSQLITGLLAEGCGSASETVRQLAANTLVNLDAEHPVLLDIAPRQKRSRARFEAHTSITVHGTWARLRSDWWKPNTGAKNLHQYLLENVSRDLYAGKYYFRWDGRYAGGARQGGAEDLQKWCKKAKVRTLDTIYAHSHGGNVVLDAALRGTQGRLLVLMGVPSLKRSLSDWSRIKTNIKRIVALHSKLDIVILADRSRLRFPDDVRQIPIPRRWFSHGVILRPATWESLGLADEIKHERRMAR